MKNCILLLVILFSATISYSQKQDSPASVKPNIKIIPAKTVNQKLVDLKLLQLQATIKKLETTLKEAKAEMDKLKDQKESLSELSRQDMLYLQRFMEQKSQLESMISNVMKAASETQSNIAKNLKAS